MHGNALEALIGAIYLDKGYNRVRSFILRIIDKHIHLETLENQETDFKSRMIEWAQKNHAEISFECQEEYNALNSQPIFIARVKIQDDLSGIGKGQSKKEAEQNAAEQAFYKLGGMSAS
jgi:ribonuclease-3